MYRFRRCASLAFLFAVVTITSGCYSIAQFGGGVRADGGFVHTQALDGPLDLEVESRSGRISVTGTDANEIEIIAEVQAWSDTLADAEALVEFMREFERARG